MTSIKLTANYFMLETFDPEQWCPVLQARFEVRELAALRRVLGTQADDDPDLRHGYRLDPLELAAVVEAFAVRFDPTPLQVTKPGIGLHRMHSVGMVPYLVHSGYELPLLLDGRKRLAIMDHLYRPMSFDGEERFDHWVAKGMLHREEVVEPVDPPTKKYRGFRRIYYTRKGEEWRIPATKLIWEASSQAEGWNEHYERLQSMLFGYDDWQTDWWINHGLQGGGFEGVRLCCAVDATGLAWIEAAGFRALPPVNRPSLAITSYDATAEVEMRAFMLEDADSVALVRFNVFGGIRHLLDLKSSAPWHVPSGRIPELNRNMRRSVVVAIRRDDQPG